MVRPRSATPSSPVQIRLSPLLKRLHQFVAQLKNVERIEVLPYHTLGAYKWKELGLGYPLEGIDPPTEKQLQIANTILETGK